MVAASGMPLAMPLASVTMSGRDVEVLRRKHLAGAAHAGLHFVVNQQNAVFVRDAAQFVMKLGRRHQVAAFALNGLDNNSGNFFGGQNGLEEPVFDDLHAFDIAGGRLLAVRAAIAVSIGNVLHRQRWDGSRGAGSPCCRSAKARPWCGREKLRRKAMNLSRPVW